MSHDSDRTAALMTPAMLAQLRMKGKPEAAASPAAWLNQLAADAGSGHARRLVDLRKTLESQSREWSHTQVQSALASALELLPSLDFNLLQPKGWLARATGKGREEAAGFAKQADRIGGAVESFTEEVHALRKTHQIQAAAQERTLGEFETEIKALEQIIEQGSRWLQDMRSQLRVRQSQGPDEAAREAIAQDEKRCELLVDRVKLLRAATSAARHAQDLCRTGMERRGALLQALQQCIETEVEAWQQRMAPLAAEAGKGAAVTAGVDGARQAHQQLEGGLQEAVRHAKQLAQQQKDLHDELAVLHKPLEAAA
jgi:hypothetical protein